VTGYPKVAMEGMGHELAFISPTEVKKHLSQIIISLADQVNLPCVAR
jgi:hypothetical protein